MSGSVQLDLRETLSRKACAVILSSLIKFIAFNNAQIPYVYEDFQRLICLKRNGIKQKNDDDKQSTFVPPSFKQMRAKAFYDKIEQVYNGFEMTFKCIEEELTAGNVFEELAIVLGATLVSPKHIFRIKIPDLTKTEACDKAIRSNLLSIYRSIVTNGAALSGRCSGLTNIFVLINGLGTPTLGNGWFIPKNDFILPTTAAQTFISFNNSRINGAVGCENLTILSSSDHSTCNVVDPANKLPIAKNNWYLAKQTLNGFQDLKINGVSVLMSSASS